MTRPSILLRVIAFVAVMMSSTLEVASSRTIDIVSPVAGKDATIYRFNIRHVLKHVRGVRNVYVVCRPTPQMRSIVLQTNLRFAGPGQRIILVNEAIFDFTFDSIRAYLRAARPTEGFDGKPFDGTVVTPDVCPGTTGPKQEHAQWVHLCRQPLANETSADGKTVLGHKRGTWDRVGWMLQQFIKMGCSPELIPGIGDAYLVVDADTVFSEEYWPFPRDGQPSEAAFNYMPGDARDCANPPYFMTLEALKVPMWKQSTLVCAGHVGSRRCKPGRFCPIAHGMVYSQRVLAAFRDHAAAVGRNATGKADTTWWQAVLALMPAWHTSPFSEYVTYYAYALAFHPETVRVFAADQMGASEDEVSPNYYMSNGLGVTSKCDLVGFAAATPEARRTHLGALGYCRKGSSACEFYRPADHPPGSRCTAPIYESYHGFRNSIGAPIHRAFEEFDLGFLAEHEQEAARVEVLGGGGGGGSGGGGGGGVLKTGRHPTGEAAARESALAAIDAKLGASHAAAHAHAQEG